VYVHLSRTRKYYKGSVHLSSYAQAILPIEGTQPTAVGLLEGQGRVGLRPFLKWAGGKTRLLSHMLPYAPERMNNYFEPFVGGGAMYFALRERIDGQAFLSDLNEELINAWLAVQHHPDELQDALAFYAERDSREFYLSIRTAPPASKVERAAWFIYLNQTSWNGLWRVNKFGVYNVPWGNRSFKGLGATHLAALHEGLVHAHISVDDFRERLKAPQPGDFVYMDPPYLPLSDTSKFFFYTEKRFREPDLRELARICQDLTRRGVRWMLSNRDTPLVRELFADADIIGLTVSRSVAAQNARNVEARNSPEVVIVGRPESAR